MISLFVLLTVFIVIRVIQKRKNESLNFSLDTATFESGNVDSINPNAYLDEQADLLPYDKSFEFPVEKLKLGKQLGAGAFGVVLKGTAQGIISYDEESTVAVKMVKKMADNETIRSLVLELKILIHIGTHMNVVNLLGAVTKDIAKRELLVIVEYCRYGNLQSYLVDNRDMFVIQRSDGDILINTEETLEQLAENRKYFHFN